MKTMSTKMSMVVKISKKVTKRVFHAERGKIVLPFFKRDMAKQ
jgi:hypothetical protein